MIRAIMIIALMMLVSKVTGQESSSGDIISKILESNLLFESESVIPADLQDELSALIEDPVNINSKDESEIGRLFFLTLFQVRSIIDYTSKRGDIISPYELSYISGFDEELASMVTPFIETGTRIDANLRRPATSNRLLINIITKDKADKEYPGSNLKSLVKISRSNGPVSMGLTMEKDAGEVMFDENGFPDFVSGYVRYTGNKIARSLIIGDYRVKFGQGLVAWTGYSTGTSPLLEVPMKGVNTILPYSSTNENDFFRGIATSLRIGKTNIHSYISSNRIDASLEDLAGGEKQISYFPVTGLHNSPLSLSRKDAVTEESLGFNVNRIFGNLYTGVSLAGTRFSYPVMDSELISRIYDFSGRLNASISVDYVFNLGKTYLYGEVAANPGGKYALLQGIRIVPASRVKINLLYAGTGKGYNSFNGKIMGRETLNDFRKTILANLYCEIAPHTTVGAGILSTRELWYNNNSEPPAGSDKFGFSIRYTPPANVEIRAELYSRRFPDYNRVETGIKQISYRSLTFERINIVLIPSQTIKLTTRLQHTRVMPAGENGFLCYQTFNWAPRSFPVKLILRYNLFRIESFDARIYVWEDDLLYSQVISPFSDDGNRFYVLLQYKPGKIITLRAKYGHTELFTSKYNHRISNEFRLQVKIDL